MIKTSIMAVYFTLCTMGVRVPRAVGHIVLALLIHPEGKHVSNIRRFGLRYPLATVFINHSCNDRYKSSAGNQ